MVGAELGLEEGEQKRKEFRLTGKTDLATGLAAIRTCTTSWGCRESMSCAGVG